MVRAQIESGRYDDVSDVVTTALRLLGEHDRLRELRVSLARADQQIDRGDAAPWSLALMERLREEAEELDRRGVSPHPDACP
jgi:putative addiction module CopG family antidote